MAFKNIHAHLDEKGILRIDSLPCINRGENVSVGVEVAVSPVFLAGQPDDVSFFVEYKSADNKRYVSPRIQIADNKLVCDVKNSVLCCAGEAQLQIVAIQNDGEYIFKSQIATFFVGESINATNKEVFGTDFLAEANKLVDRLHALRQQTEQTEQRLADLIDTITTKLDNGEFVGRQGDDGKTPTLLIVDGDLFANYD